MLKNLFDFMCTGRVKKRYVERPKSQSKEDEFVAPSVDDKPLEEAIKEERYTPIDFDTLEVKNDGDVESSPCSTNSDIVSFTPSPIPEVAQPYRRRSSMSFRHKPTENLAARRVASVNRVVDMKQTSHRRSFHTPAGLSTNQVSSGDYRTTSTPKTLVVRPTRVRTDDFDSGKIAFLEKRIRELELSNIEATSPKFSRSSRREAIEIGDELLRKDMKVKKLENKLLKAYQKMERLSDENLEIMHNVTIERSEAKKELEKCLERMEQLENELDYTRESVHNETTRQLNETIWKQDRELRETRKVQSKLKEKEEECEEMKKFIVEVETKNEELMKKIDDIQKNQKTVSNVVLSQTNYGQSCSSSSTPISDDHEMLKHRGSTQLLRNVHKDGEITPFMSRTIREQNRSIATCRAMVACMKNACEKMEKGGKLDVRALFGNEILSEFTDDSFEEEAEDSTPFSMYAAENVLSKQSQNLTQLDSELNAMRQKIIAFQTDETQKITEGDRETCRLQ